jgi:hypothetical protein
MAHHLIDYFIKLNILIQAAGYKCNRNFIFEDHITLYRTMQIIKHLYLIALLFLFSGSGFSQSRYISATTKKIVFTRDGGKCQCCGLSFDLEYDHIIPFSCGGSSEASNIQLLCMKCNRSKSNSCVCKIHNKIVGSDCCDGKTTKRSSSTSQQCSGTTKKGARCKRKTTNTNGRCHLH